MENHQHPKTSVHAVVIALAILNAVGMLVLYFKIDILSTQVKTMPRTTDVVFTPPPSEKTKNIPSSGNTSAQTNKTAGFGENVFLKPGEAFTLLSAYDTLGIVKLQSIDQNSQKDWVVRFDVIDHTTGKTKQFELGADNKICADTSIGGMQLRAINKDEVVLFPQPGCE